MARMQRSVIREYIARISLRSIRLMLATRLDSHIIYRHQKPSEIVCVAEIIKVGRNFHTILVVVAGLQTAPSKSTSFESASHFRLCDYSMIVGMARSDPITLAAAVQRCFCCKSRNIRGLHFVSPFGTPILLLAKRVESIDQRANPAYDLCLGAFPTPPPSVNLETAVTSITYTETVENYRCLWDNFFAAPMTNHISCH